MAGRGDLGIAMVVGGKEGGGSVKGDMEAIGYACRDMGAHAVAMLATSFATAGFLRWLATIAAIYLLVIDRTAWRTSMTVSLLIPYIFLNFPPIIFDFLRGDVGKWVAFIAVVLRLFLSHYFPDLLELPGALIILIVVAPSLLAVGLRANVLGVIISLLMGAWLLQQHIKAAGGFRKAFAERHGVRNTIGILLLFVSPLWEVIKALF